MAGFSSVEDARLFGSLFALLFPLVRRRCSASGFLLGLFGRLLLRLLGGALRLFLAAELHLLRLLRVVREGGGDHLSFADAPLFVADVVDEGVVVRDDHDGTLELAERVGERRERVVVEVVGRLVHGDDVREGPHGGGEDEARALAAAHALDLAHGEVLVDAELGEVLRHLDAGDRAQVHAALLRLHQLVVVAHELHDVRVLALEVRDRVPLRVALVAPRLSHLVLERVAPRRAPHNLADLPARLRALLLLRRQVHHVHLGHLPIAAFVVAVLEVGHRRELERGLEVVHAVLREVGEPQVVVLVNLARAAVPGRVEHHLPHHQLHQRRLARAVQPHKRHARVEAELCVGVLEDPPLGARVLEAERLDGHDGSVAVRDAFELPGVREGDGRDVRAVLAHEVEPKLGAVAVLLGGAVVLARPRVARPRLAQRGGARHA
mmetsp:Transcript_10120/g.33185  ORF Transcript_10120/g.33185 Transcript_10120/m.33185 type:complete len:436 (-) Transcript_10120:2604-3911(-)